MAPPCVTGALRLAQLTPLLVLFAPSCGQIQDELVPASYVRVTTILVEPYASVRDESRNISDSRRYEGYVVDLLNKVSRTLGFQYQLTPVKDGRYGYRQSDGTWDGMVGELMRKEADIAAAPLYITDHRSEVIDFSRPFLQVEATLLMKRPPTGKKTSIQIASDLLTQDRFTYGTLNAGVIIRAFRTSNDSVYRAIWRKMRKFQPSAFTETNEDGIDRARNDDYVYIIPSTIGEYIKRRAPCDLITADNFLMERAYGLAVQKGSALLPRLNKILSLLEINGFLHHLYKKWWVDHNDCNAVKTSKHIYSPSIGSCFSPSLPLYLLIGTVSFRKSDCIFQTLLTCSMLSCWWYQSSRVHLR